MAALQLKSMVKCDGADAKVPTPANDIEKLREAVAKLSAELAMRDAATADGYVEVQVSPPGKANPGDVAKVDVKIDVHTAAGASDAAPKVDPVGKTTATCASAKRTAVARLGLKRGLKPTRVTIPYSFNLSCSVSGVVNSTQLILADVNTVEWAAFAALYDEYKVHGGRIEFCLPYVTNVPTASGGLSLDSMMFVMAYDPTDPNSLGGIREGCELAQHRLLSASPIQVGATGSQTTNFGFRCANSKPFRFDWSTKNVKDLAISSTGVLNYTPGMWKGINPAGQNNPDGQIKVFGQSSFTASATCCSGINYIDVEFRSRK